MSFESLRETIEAELANGMTLPETEQAVMAAHSRLQADRMSAEDLKQPDPYPHLDPRTAPAADGKRPVVSYRSPLSPMTVKRLKMALRQEDLASDLGITRQYLGKLEHGRALPSMRLAHQIATHLGSSIEELFPERLPPRESAMLD